MYTDPSAPDVAARDRALIARLRAGETASLDGLLHAYGAALVRYAARVTGSDDLAQDVVQDVFHGLWVRRTEHHVDGSAAPYLYRLTRNRAIDVMRALHAAHERDARWTDESLDALGAVWNRGERTLEEHDVRLAVARALESVPPRCREIFFLAWEDGLAYADIATMLGISVLTARNQMSRAVRRLAEVFDPAT